MKKTVIAGHICLDIFPQFQTHIDLQPGRLYEIGRTNFAIGGAVSNTGLTMHKLGMPVTLMGKIGDDSYGRQISAIVHSHAPGLENGLKIDSAVDSSYSINFCIPGIDRMFFHCPGANASFNCGDIAWDTVAEADLFHFGYPAFMAGMYADNGSQLISMFQHAKELNVTTSLDPGMPDPSSPAGKVPWQDVLAALLPSVDVFMPSADELLYMIQPDKFGQGDNLDENDLHDLSSRLIRMGAAVVAIKLGHRGMYIQTAGRDRFEKMGRGAPAMMQQWTDAEMWFPIFKPAVFKNATGAGDASIGAFLSAMLRGHDIVYAGRFAAAVGASNVEADDSLGGIRSWDETAARIADGWETVSPTVTMAKWRKIEGGVLSCARDESPEYGTR